MEKDVNKIKEKFVEYITDIHKHDLLKILQCPDPSLYFVVHIDLLDLLMSTEYQDFLTKAEFYINILNLSLYQSQIHIVEQLSDTDFNLTIKKKITARLVSLPEADGVFIKYPTCLDVNKLICFNGTVTKTFDARMLEASQTYQCGKCGQEFTVQIDYCSKDLLVRPSKCTKDDCQSDKFKLINDEKNLKSNAKDYQEIKVQEKLDIYSAGSVPKSIIVILENDLVDSCKPGDDVTINAVVLKRWGRLTNEMRCDIDLILLANYVKVNNEEQTHINITKEKEKFFVDFWKTHNKRPLTARNIILASYCPQLYGMYIVKLAVCLVLTGGVSRKDSSGTRVRGESHLLLVGDPGTGKSQFLKYANKIIPKSVLTTGIGSTSAGLTATASRDGGLWHLEAGALVLADGGICCVDEFNCMKEQDKMSMLEAMEQQSISVAKAGIVCKLRTQCSVLAACNPKGQYDSTQPITINLAMSSPLLSRFDIILLLLDTPNKEWDHLASTFLLEGIDLLRKDKKTSPIWDFDHLRLYFNFVKALEPNLTQEANIVIQKYYQLQRKSDERSAARTTVRMLESIIRLSQAHAKLMLREEVLLMDAIVAITLIECSINRTASFGNVNILHTSFPEDAEIEYRNQAELILQRLGLTDLLLEEIKLIENNFEPFCNQFKNSNQPKTSKELSPNLNLTMHNYDIISQMVSDVPTQICQNRSNTTILNSTSRFSSTKNNLLESNKSLNYESDIIKLDESKGKNDQDYLKPSINMKRKLPTSPSILDNDCINENKKLSEKDGSESFIKKSKTINSEDDNFNIKNIQNKSVNSQVKSQFKNIQADYSMKLSQAVNVKNFNFEDDDLNIDL